MKVPAHQIPTILKDSRAYLGILFYGDDTGRIRNHVAAATQALLGAAQDPFRSCVLTREEHARLQTEVTSRSLGGGRRVIRVQDATDALTGMLDKLSDLRSDVLVLVEGATLTNRSKLRLMAEKHPHWATIACYPETGTALVAEIKHIVAAEGISIEQDALDYLVLELGGDSSRRRGELEKLCLYAAGMGTVTVEIAQAAFSSGLDATLTAAVAASLSGQAARCDALMDELGRDGTSGPGVLAVLSNEVQRLLKVRLMMESGRSLEDVARSLHPPVFPRQMPGFRQEVQRWNIPRLESLSRAVREADVACKRAASPDFAIAARLLSVVATRASQA